MNRIFGIFSPEGINLSWQTIKIIWLICGIPLGILFLLGMAMRIQAGGAEGGSEYWGPVVTVICIIWIISWPIIGVFF